MSDDSERIAEVLDGSNSSRGLGYVKTLVSIYVVLF